MQQLTLFGHVAAVYAEHTQPLRNDVLYDAVAKKAGVAQDDLRAVRPIGKAGTPRSPVQRKIRWAQQTLKTLGLLERVPEKRGEWQLTSKGKEKLTKADDDTHLLGFASDLGVAIWAKCNTVFAGLNEPIHLCLTSPPYPLRSPRAYGNPTEHEYIDFICATLEPIVRNLVPGGSIALNISNDIFEAGSPARSLYRERLVLALADRLGLYKMDELIWENPNKPPGPVQWASLRRMQLNVGYEPVYWFTNDPARVFSNNQRVLQPHSESHLQLIQRGGENRTRRYGDGAYSLRPGSFGNPTAGRIPRNVLRFSHVCQSQQDYKAYCREHGLPANQAPMPLALAKFLIEFLTEPGHLVVEPFGGSFTTALAAELLGRRWIATEQVLEYILGARSRFHPSALKAA